MKNSLAGCALLAVLLIIGCDKKEDVTPSFPNLGNPGKPANTDTIKGKKPVDSTDSPWLNYQIPKGGHYCSIGNFALFQEDSMAFYFSFDSTAIYQTVDAKNQADWNKLMGFSDCQSHHHQNSVRLVWRWNENGAVEIGEYFYRNGIRSFTKLTTVQIGDTSLAIISVKDGFYHLQVNEIFSKKERKCSNRSSSYWLYPYFGGDEAAPHEVHVFVRHLYPAE